MAVIVLASAHGSPGVTTSALGLAMSWPRPVVLVEADPAGASGVLGGYFRGELEARGGLINLAVALREGSLRESLPRECLVLDPARGAEASEWFLPGIQSHEQAPSLVPLWEPLLEELRRLERNGQDVIVDAGRLGGTGWPHPLVHGADLLLLTCRNTLPALAAGRGWAGTLRREFAEVGGLGRIGLLLVDEGKRWSSGSSPVPRVRPYTARQVTRALELPVLATVPWDPASAEAYSHGAKPPRKADNTPLARSLRAAVSAIDLAVHEHRRSLATPAPSAAATGAEAGEVQP